MTSPLTELGATVNVGPEGVAYVGVGGMLLMLFRLVFRALSVKDTEVLRLVEQLRTERDRAQRWSEYHRQRADHWYAVALGDPNPPIIPTPPADLAPMPTTVPDPLPPPS